MHRLSRRRFIRELGGGIAGGVVLSSLAGVACGGAGSLTGSTAFGAIAGTVIDESGERASIGEIYLMRADGLQTGRYVSVETDGTWKIREVPPGEWQVRFWGSGRAHVLHDRATNPRRLTVRAGQTARAEFPVGLAPHHGEDMVQIYIGDDFFQEQPLGDPNAPTRVPRGYEVCWYNVTESEHEVVGGPWETSGVLEPRGSFIWVADQTGEFPYECPLHQPEQQAKLVVVEG